MTDLEEKFNSSFNQFKEEKDKFESLYIFVIIDVSKEEMDNTLDKMLKSMDGISDTMKKNTLKGRINDFKKYLENSGNAIISGIFMLGNQIKCIPFDKYYLETLKMFKIDKITYKYNKTFEIDWLKKFLTDRDYTNVIKLKNNDISISKITSTKQLCTYSDTIKSMNVKDILATKMEKDIKFFVHGSSNNLKQLNDYKNKLFLGIVNKELNLEEIQNYIEDAKYQENIKEVTEWLTKLLDPKDGNKLVFGNDVVEQAEMGLLKTIYCSQENYQKYSKFDNVELKLIKSSKKDDNVLNFEKSFNSVLGIKYY
jgi:hypothetical protein